MSAIIHSDEVSSDLVGSVSLRIRGFRQGKKLVTTYSSYNNNRFQPKLPPSFVELEKRLRAAYLDWQETATLPEKETP